MQNETKLRRSVGCTKHKNAPMEFAPFQPFPSYFNDKVLVDVKHKKNCCIMDRYKFHMLNDQKKEYAKQML